MSLVHDCVRLLRLFGNGFEDVALPTLRHATGMLDGDAERVVLRRLAAFVGLFTPGPHPRSVMRVTHVR